MSDETGLERAEQNFRALVRCRSNGGGLEDFLAEYDQRGEEIGRRGKKIGRLLVLSEEMYQLGYSHGEAESEALGLLRELAKYWVRLESDGKDWSKVCENLGPTARDLKRRIRALVERAGPAGAHPAESDKENHDVRD